MIDVVADFGKIIIADLILSGDNALIIGGLVAARHRAMYAVRAL